MAKRFEGSISVDPRKVGSLIGKKGGNLKSVSQAAGHGTYIVAFNSADAKRSGKKLSDYVRTKARELTADSFYISSGSVGAVRRAAGLLKNPVRPSNVVTVSPEAIGTIIGQGGSGIRNICSLAGNHCFIVHKHEEGGFVVTADTKMAVARGVQKIKDAEKDYFQSQRDFRRNRNRREDVKSEESNRYEGLNFSSDEDDEIVNEVTKPVIKLGFQRNGSIASRKGENSARWVIREKLLMTKIDFLEGGGKFEEAEKLSIHDISWDDVTDYQEKTAESRSARRIQLSVQNKDRAPNFNDHKDFQSLPTGKSPERQYTMPDLGKWSSGANEDVVSNEGVENMKKVAPEKSTPEQFTSPNVKPFSGSWADALDSDSDSDVEQVDLS